MPSRKRPVYGMEECVMAERCGGTPAFAAVLQTCWSMRKTPVLSANVSDDHTTSLKSAITVRG